MKTQDGKQIIRTICKDCKIKKKCVCPYRGRFDEYSIYQEYPVKKKLREFLTNL